MLSLSFNMTEFTAVKSHLPWTRTQSLLTWQWSSALIASWARLCHCSGCRAQTLHEPLDTLLNAGSQIMLSPGQLQ